MCVPGTRAVIEGRGVDDGCLELLGSVQLSHSVVSNSLQPHGLKHSRLLCPSPTPGAWSNSLSIELVMPSNHLIFCRPLLFLPSILPSIRVFSNESILHSRWPKYWSFNFSISSSNEYSGLIFFRIDWFDLLAVQGTVFSSTTVQKHQFFGAQPSLQLNKGTVPCISDNILSLGGQKTQRNSYSNNTEVCRIPEPDILLRLNSFATQKHGVQ